MRTTIRSGSGKLEIGAINILNPDGTLNDSVPEKYRGLTMKKARAAVVEDMEAAGLLVEIEDREIDLAHSDRSKTPIEPYLADQWFVKMDELAQSAMDAVTDGRVKILPERYTKTYLDWLSEKRDWPVGRQLWWGHRIPVWHQAVDDNRTWSTRRGNRPTSAMATRLDLGKLCSDLARIGAAMSNPSDDELHYIFQSADESDGPSAAISSTLPRRMPHPIVSYKRDSRIAGDFAQSMRKSSTPGSPPPSGRTRHWVGRTRRPNSRRSIPRACSSRRGILSRCGSRGWC